MDRRVELTLLAAGPDEAAGARIAADLIGEGRIVDMYVDPERSLSDWNSVAAGIARSGTTIAILSHNSMNSPGLAALLRFAKSSGVPIVPVALGGRVALATAPPDLLRLQWIDIEDRDGIRSAVNATFAAAPPVAVNDGVLPLPPPSSPAGLESVLISPDELPLDRQLSILHRLRELGESGDERQLMAKLLARPDLRESVRRAATEHEAGQRRGRSVVWPLVGLACLVLAAGGVVLVAATRDTGSGESSEAASAQGGFDPVDLVPPNLPDLGLADFEILRTEATRSFCESADSVDADIIDAVQLQELDGDTHVAARLLEPSDGVGLLESYFAGCCVGGGSPCVGAIGPLSDPRNEVPGAVFYTLERDGDRTGFGVIIAQTDLVGQVEVVGSVASSGRETLELELHYARALQRSSEQFGR